MKVPIIKIIHHFEVFLTYDSIEEWEIDYYKQQIKRAKQFKKQGKTSLTWDEFYAK
jgi:hypothetical protein